MNRNFLNQREAINEGYDDYLSEQAEASPELPMTGFRRELQTIFGLPSEKRRVLRAKLKEDISLFQNTWNEILQEVVSLIRSKPDISKTDFLTYIDERFQKKIDTNQKDRAMKEEIAFATERAGMSFDLYREKHDIAANLMSKHPDPADLFFTLFGKKPAGKVEARMGIAHLHFDCFKRTDFYTAYYYPNRPPSAHEIKKNAHSNITGVEFWHYVPGETDVICTATNVALLNRDYTLSAYAYLHEEQHVITDLFEEGVYETRYSDADALKLFRALQENDRLSLFRILRESVRKFRRTNIDARAKSEILSYTRESMPSWEIEDKLIGAETVGGIYDYAKHYLENPRILMKELLGEYSAQFTRYKEYQPYFEEVAEEILKDEYEELIKKSLRVVNDLREFLEYGEIVVLLAKEPIQRWPAVANRELKKLKAEQEDYMDYQYDNDDDDGN